MSGYVGSRALEIDAMLAQISAGSSHRAADPASPAAGTDGLESERVQGFATRQVTPRFTLAGDDGDAVEHERQNRLRRWRTQP